VHKLKLKVEVFDERKTVVAVKCKAPKQTNSRNRTWDKVGSTEFAKTTTGTRPDGTTYTLTEYDIIADTTSGLWAYFYYKNHWHKFRIYGE